MNITKYEHACLVIEEQGKKLVIDPGEYTTSLNDFAGVVAVVVTHVHPDHCGATTLRAIAQQNPAVRIFGTAEVAQELPDLTVTAVAGGTAETVAPFSLEFYGELHAEIHPTMPRAQNVGVFVNDTLYYPGDSFTAPNKPVKLLACPASAPWLRAHELIDFLREVKPAMAIPTHNALLTSIGHDLMNGVIQRTCAEANGAFTFVQPGETLTV